MSDAPPPVRTASPSDAGAVGGPLTPDAIERVLADFRTWLIELTSLPAPAEEPPAVDLHTLVAQFTALRQEVNLQTRSARSALEQNGEALATLRSTVEQLQEQPASDSLEPMLKAVVDVYDNLALALRQVEKQREAIEGPLQGLTTELLPPEMGSVIEAPARTRGFLSFLFGQAASPRMRTIHEAVDALRKEMEARRKKVAEASKQVRSSFDSLIAGYRMSLARIDRILEQSDLEPIGTVGETFDPELMEVVEVVGDSGKPAGEVLEEVRRGYLRGEVVFRYAQVKVAR
jgi:molecular chaperone GrpE